MHFLALLLSSLATTAAAAGAPPPPDLAQVLRKIAESQEQSIEARSRVVYTQYIHAKLHRANGKIAREEKRTYTVTPTPKGFQRHLARFEGVYADGSQLIPFYEPRWKHKGLDLDAELMDDLINDWTGNAESRDGIDRELFPMTAAHQQKYKFTYAGTARQGAENRHRIAYEPLSKRSAPWKGDIFVEPESLYPTSLNSTFAYHIPMAVKIIFGISLRQVGFSVNYARAIDDLWLPVTAGTEFHWRVLFGYARTLTLSLKNSEFRRASAESTIRFGEPPAKEAAQP